MIAYARYGIYDKVKPYKGTLIRGKYLGQLLLPMMINCGQQQYTSLFDMYHLIFRRRSDGYHHGVSPSRCLKAKVGGHNSAGPSSSLPDEMKIRVLACGTMATVVQQQAFEFPFDAYCISARLRRTRKQSIGWMEHKAVGRVNTENDLDQKVEENLFFLFFLFGREWEASLLCNTK